MEKDMPDKDFEVGIGMSRKWEAFEAGREVAENTLSKLKKDPDILLLFSTIHYEYNGGFNEFLDGVWDVLPQKTIVVGGTVAGFINHEGCFTHGASALALSHDSMDISVGVGNNIKRSPEKAVKECLEGMDGSSVNPNLYLEFVSGPIIPSFPGMGKQTVIRSKSKGNLFKKMVPTLFKANMGTDRADEFLEYLSKYIDSPLIGAVCYDDGSLSKNYQFYNKQVLKNSAILAGLKSDFDMEFETVTALKDRDKKINIKVEKDGRTVTQINNKPATEELFKLLNWNEGSVQEVEKFYSQAFYYPFCYHRDNQIHAAMLGLILGQNIYFANKIESNQLQLFGLTGKKIISECERIFSKESNLLYGVMCETYIETLGNSIYKVRDIIDKYANNYLLIFAGGESIINTDKTPHHLYESINILRA